MAVVSYPGVYIDELESGNRTITGVATSITAFVGRAARGPLDQATLIHSQSDYDRTFGGLDRTSPMSFAVRDFFLNGGSTALIVRLFNGAAGVASMAFGSPAVFSLDAANPGTWGRNLTAALDRKTLDATAQALGVTQAQLFNLTVNEVVDNVVRAVEVHRNVTFVESARRIDRVLAESSQLVRWPSGPVPTSVTIPQTPEILTSATSAVGSDGDYLTLTGQFNPTGAKDAKVGLYALEQADGFNLLVIPPNLVPNDVVADGNLDPDLITLASAYCKERRAILILDGDKDWSKQAAFTGVETIRQNTGGSSQNAALFYPRIEYGNPFNDNRLEAFICGGAVAGIIARTDAERGVWKAPAGLDAAVAGVSQLAVELTDPENGDLNQRGINCLRTKPGVGRVVWGARTLSGDDRLSSEWKYLPVRRTALFIEESLFRGTEWAVFEPNDEPLWAQLRANVGAFMQSLFLDGAFQGTTPDEAYFVKCDDETTTQDDINRGIVNVLVGFAPLKPAEFVVISLQQMAGQATT